VPGAAAALARTLTLRPFRNRRPPEPEPGAQPRPPPSPGTPDGPGIVDTSKSEVPTWEEVARDYGRYLFTVAYRLTGNQDDAADLVQEVLLRVRRGLPSYRPGSMEGWLGRITTNLFLDDMRRRRRRPVESLSDVADRTLPAAAGADDELVRQTLGADIQAALNALPEEFRAAIVLRDVAGLPYAEISEALDVPVGTVRSRIHRGRALLRESLR
jgi:RNA polymerase sigma-70 factor (ECF subfamily)